MIAGVLLQNRFEVLLLGFTSRTLGQLLLVHHSRGIFYTDFIFPGEKYTVPDFDEPARELFVWSVLMNRLDMAMHFWDEGKEGTSAALAAQRLLKSMLERTEDSEISKEITANIEYVILCVGLNSFTVIFL